MTLTSEKVADLRLKHLEMLQAVVLRMSSNSATVRNYCITLTSAVVGVSLTVQRPVGALLALIIAAFCALLDAQYLRLERRFRCLYDKSREEGFDALPTFEIKLSSAPIIKFRSVLLSWHIGFFYVPLIICIIATLAITWWSYGRII